MNGKVNSLLKAFAKLVNECGWVLHLLEELRLLELDVYQRCSAEATLGKKLAWRQEPYPRTKRYATLFQIRAH